LTQNRATFHGLGYRCRCIERVNSFLTALLASLPGTSGTPPRFRTHRTRSRPHCRSRSVERYWARPLGSCCCLRPTSDPEGKLQQCWRKPQTRPAYLCHSFYSGS